jgi:hypothetical protein
MNPLDSKIAKEQIDVRRMPTGYAHRKIREMLAYRLRDLILDRERKYRSNLSDHQLFAIICEARSIDKSRLNLDDGLPNIIDQAAEEQEYGFSEEDKEETDSTFDWT